MQQGDVLLSLDGVQIKDKGHYLQLIRNMTRGQGMLKSVMLYVARGDQGYHVRLLV